MLNFWISIYLRKISFFHIQPISLVLAENVTRWKCLKIFERKKSFSKVDTLTTENCTIWTSWLEFNLKPRKNKSIHHIWCHVINCPRMHLILFQLKRIVSSTFDCIFDCNVHPCRIKSHHRCLTGSFMRQTSFTFDCRFIQSHVLIELITFWN